ncbi:polyphenol oxidase family protein [Persephonella sp. KM09-Lau-8]|uniref:polyphenol oxidase family protein n=1 Tax=Persephonella sp. KM09-Lau-8 TaxID=1158345 RepID=UPI0009E08E48|nr:polyphenol oxidase family protein [Persephonella sp. KM09-Lau-8]
MKHLKIKNLNIVFTEKEDGNMREPSNREKLVNKFPIKNLLVPNQKHTANIIFPEDINQEADGIVIDKKNIAGGVLTADCMPVVLTDFNRLVVIHAGWKGLLAGIIQKGIEFFEKKENIYAFIGAHARKCCYEVQQDFIEKNSIEKKYIYKENNKLTFAMSELAADILKKHGVRQVEDISICTICNDNLFSYRKGNFNERILTFAWLEE